MRKRAGKRERIGFRCERQNDNREEASREPCQQQCPAGRNLDDLFQITVDQDQPAGYQQVHQHQANNTGSFLFEQGCQQDYQQSFQQMEDTEERMADVERSSARVEMEEIVIAQVTTRSPLGTSISSV